MIQANELRIGNVLMHKKSGKYIQFKSFEGLHNVYMNTEDYAPIPLTEEILLKCGIEVKDGSCEIDRIEFEWDREIGLMLDNISILINPYKRLHQLHQLQNLYFALTGQELTVNI